MLFGQDGADEADESVAVGEDADDIGAAADLLVQAFLRVVGPDLPPDLFRERGEREQVGPGLVEMVGDRGQLLGQGVDDPVELYVGDRLIARGELTELDGDNAGQLAVRLTEVANLRGGL